MSSGATLTYSRGFFRTAAKLPAPVKLALAGTLRAMEDAALPTSADVATQLPPGLRAYRRPITETWWVYFTISTPVRATVVAVAIP